MTEDERLTPKDSALDIVQSLPDSSSLREILFAINSQSQIDDAIFVQRDLEDSKSEPPTRSAWTKASESMGCIGEAIGVGALLLLIFILMPVMFAVGDRILSRPPRVIEKGTIVDLEFTDASRMDSYTGAECRVLANHIAIDSAEGAV